MNRGFIILIFFLCFIACSNRQPAQDTNSDTASSVATPQSATTPDTFSKATLLPHITCRSDASQSYALYIPATPKTISLPILFCFDPHGDGSLPLTQYKALADAFGFILVGSNNSKNGNDWNTTQNIINTLFNDVQSRVSFDGSRIYTCGFSGGAKVAGYAALHRDNIKSIITAGAGLPEEEALRSFPFSITSLAGRGDMNMTDLIAMNTALDQTATVHRLILFDGKHAWPPADVMRTAFTALKFDAMRNNLKPKNDSLIHHYEAAARSEIKTEEAAGEWLPAEQTCALAMNLLMNIDSTGWFSAEQANIKNNPAYAQQQQQTQQLLAQEEQTKQTFQQQFSQGDAAYWQTTIASLQQKAKGATPEAAMYQRLLAYLSLAFYSLSNRLIAGNQNEAAQHFITLYKLADATNSEAWYLSAVLNARSSNTAAAESDLRHAVSLGFTDVTRLRGQPEFAALLPQLHLDDVEKKMKGTF